MATTTAVLRAEPFPLSRRFLAMLPGIALLTIVGLAGKVLEKSIATYTKAHHLVVPNIEYVFVGDPDWPLNLKHHRRCPGFQAGNCDL